MKKKKTSAKEELLFRERENVDDRNKVVVVK